MADPHYYPPETCENMFPKTDTSQTFIQQRYYFEGCDFGKTSVLYCAKPLIEKKYTCIQKCVECHDDPWTCTKWETQGCDTEGAFQVTSEPCGAEYLGNFKWSVQNWTSLDASSWICPNARKLAELYTPQESGLSFNELSIGGKSSNSILRSGESTDLTFSAYVEACLNRIPLLRLTVELKDAYGGVPAREYGLYAKHRTLDYLHENRGLIEQFVIPDQLAFREAYQLESTLNGYVGWAWRRQFVESLEKITDTKSGNAAQWKDLPGEIPESAGRVGDIYYSSDFVGGVSLSGDQGEDCAMNLSVKRNCVINALSINEINRKKVCSADDLSAYYANYGLDEDLEGLIRAKCGISTSVDLEGLIMDSVKTPVELSDRQTTIDINTNTLFSMDYENFSAYVMNSSNTEEIYEVLTDSGAFSDSNVEGMIRRYFSEAFDVRGCGDYEPVFTTTDFRIRSVDKLPRNKARLTVSVDILLTEEYLTQISLDTEFEYNCTQSWTWGNMSELNSEHLAECMYNWDRCMALEKWIGSGVYEAASSGYGPMEAVPTLENDTARILLDGKLTKETQSRPVMAYRSCGINDAWVAPQTRTDYAMLYACPVEAYLPRGGWDPEWLNVLPDLQYIGKKEVAPTYPSDASEGRQYMVLKCDRAPSADEIGFVEKVPLGSFAHTGWTAEGIKMLYICTEKGWVPWRGGDPEDKEKNKTDPKSRNFSNTFDMFQVSPPMASAGLGQGDYTIWEISALNKENYSIPVDLMMMCKEYPAAINWVDFANESEDCGSGCKVTSLELPATSDWDLYRAAYTTAMLNRADRIGSYEFEFVVRESGTGREIYRETAWLNVFSNAVGFESILPLVGVFLLAVLVVFAKPKENSNGG